LVSNGKILRMRFLVEIPCLAEFWQGQNKREEPSGRQRLHRDEQKLVCIVSGGIKLRRAIGELGWGSSPVPFSGRSISILRGLWYLQE